MAALVTLETAKLALKITDTLTDAEVQLYLDAAQAVILRYLGPAADPDWTDANLPRDVQVAILLELGLLYVWRGDDPSKVDAERKTWVAIQSLLTPWRDQAVSSGGVFA